MLKAYAPNNRRVVGKGGNLAAYLLAGYPNRQVFLEAAKDCARQGMTILEVGFPSAAPRLDGEVIRRAHEAADVSVCHDLEFWRALRNTVKTPIWLMAYDQDLIENCLYRTFCSEGLIDALVIPDLDAPRRERLLRETKNWDVDVLGFLTPESGETELTRVIERFPLVYYTLYAGQTGMNKRWESYSHITRKARSSSHDGVFAGFGIRTPQQAATVINDGFAGAVVGTVMIEQLGHSERNLGDLVRRFAGAIQDAEKRSG